MRSPRLLVAALATATIATLAITTTAGTAQASTSNSDVYTPPANVVGSPGTLLKSTASQFPLDPFGITKANATVTTVLYVSTSALGAKTAVSGTLIMPRSAWTGKGERPIVSYAAGTQGTADKCAPSRQLAAGTLEDGTFLRNLIDKGFAVAMTDYEGLGTPGNHPYVNNIALGHNVLDIVKVAQNLGYSRTAPVYVAGYSEGGGAAAGALEVAKAGYDSDLNIQTASIGAPASDLAAIANKIENSAYQSFLLFAVKMLADTYPELKLTDLTNSTGQYWLDHTDSLGCLPENLVPSWFVNSKQLTKSGQTVASYLTRPDIAAVLANLNEANHPISSSIPVRVASSWGDDIIGHDSVTSLAKAWCSYGDKVQYQTLSLPTHVLAGAEWGTQLGDYFWNFSQNPGSFKSNCGSI